MNPKSFLGMMSDISDEYIVSAAKPHSKPIRWYQISAVAACIVLLISAAIYPKLRIQTPEITEPSESVAEVITTTTSVPELAEHSETQTATLPIQSTYASVTATVNTTASVAASATVTETAASVQTDVPAATKPAQTDAAVVTDPTQTNTPITATATVNTTASVAASATVTETAASVQTNVPTATNPAQTDAAVITDPPKTDISITATAVTIETTPSTEQHIETTDNSEIPVIIEDPTIEIPLWKGMVGYPESTHEEHLYCRFFLGTGDMDAWMRTLYGIPQDFDLTQNHCLLIEIDTAYSNAVIIGCKPTQNGLTLIIAYLNDGTALNKTIHYAIPIPDNMTLEPDNCNANYLEMTDKELIQEMEKEKLELKTGNEQEGLQ